jgi:hypothetical protein
MIGFGRPERLDANRCNKAGEHDAGESDEYGKQSGAEMSRRQIAITDSKAGNERKVKSIGDPPILYASNHKPKSDHDNEHSGQNRPYHAKLPGEGEKKDAPFLS